jgi:hypothetical protein
MQERHLCTAEIYPHPAPATNEGTRRATSVLINHTKLSTSEQQMKARLQYGIAYMSGESNVQAIVKRNSED